MKTLIILCSFFCSVHALAKEIDLTKSSFMWSATKITGEKHDGTVKMKQAYLLSSQGKIKGGTFIADLQSIDVIDLKGKWKKKFLQHIKSEDFLHVKKFPVAILVISQIGDNYLEGMLTIRGKSQPVSMKFSKQGNIITSTLSFDRTKFDIVYGSNNFFKNLGDKAISNIVELKAKIVLKSKRKKPLLQPPMKTSPSIQPNR